MKREEYRIEGSSLYKYDEKSNCYIHVFRNDRLSGDALIRAYEDSLYNCWD